MPDTDPASAILAGIRERQALAADASLGFAQMEERHAALIKVAYEDMPRLLAAVERLSELADEWDAKAKKIGGQIALEDCDGATAGFKMIGYQNHRDHAAALREAIRAALAGTGKEGGDE